MKGRKSKAGTTLWLFVLTSSLKCFEFLKPVYHFTLLTSCPSSSRVTWKITILLHLITLTLC
jgi:hypothetical protein